MVVTVSSWAVVEVKRLLFVLCTVIIGVLGSKRSYTWPSTHTRCKGEGGVFLVPRQRGSEQTENGSIPLPPPGFTKQFREKAKPCCVLLSFQILYCTSAGIDSPTINLFVPVSTLHGNVCVRWRGIHFPQECQVNSPTEWDVSHTTTMFKTWPTVAPEQPHANGPFSVNTGACRLVISE